MKKPVGNKLERAKKKVADIKGFYSHLTIYIVINSLIILVHLGVFSGGSFSINLVQTQLFGIFSTPFFWGIGLFFHWFKVFKYQYSFFRNWEERKIKEFMDRDQQDFDNVSRYE